MVLVIFDEMETKQKLRLHAPHLSLTALCVETPQVHMQLMSASTSTDRPVL